MNNHEFVGKICPYCKCVLTEEDEIVVCSECEMPHHRDCWIENQGCTTFGCMGTIAGADGPAVSVTSRELIYDEPAAPTRYCAKCGTPNPMTSGFCRKCGNALSAPQAAAPAQPVYVPQAAPAPVQSAPAPAENPQPANPDGKVCPACGTVNTKTAVFCRSCATRLAVSRAQSAAPAQSTPVVVAPAPVQSAPAQTESRFCPKCGSANSGAAAFCRVCGSAMPAAQSMPVPAPAPAPVAEPMPQVAPAAQSNSKFCAKCGTAHTGSSAFCRICGHPLTQHTETVTAPIPETAAPVFAEPAAPAAEARFCSKCGTSNPASSGFCRKCGNALNAPQTGYTPAPQPVYTPVPQPVYNPAVVAGSGAGDPIVQQLVGEKSEYYMPVFWQMRTQNKMTSWNWAAFLITPFWMIYRKMYAYGAIVLGVALVLGLISPLLTLAGYVACGIFANYLYMTHLDKLAQQARAMNEPYRSQYIATNAGVNMTAAIGAAVGWAVLVLIL